jgi:hypothetical protein
MSVNCGFAAIKCGGKTGLAFLVPFGTACGVTFAMLNRPFIAESSFLEGVRSFH